MEILGIGLFLLIMFVITWVVIACNAPTIPTPFLPETYSKSFYEVENESLKAELEYIKRSCRLHHQPPFLGCGGCHHSTRYFAQTIEQQKMADMLAKAKDTAGQLVKDLSA